MDTITGLDGMLFVFDFNTQFSRTAVEIQRGSILHRCRLECHKRGYMFTANEIVDR